MLTSARCAARSPRHRRRRDCWSGHGLVETQAPIDISELADDRLADEVFGRLALATRRATAMLAIARDDAS